MNENFIEKAQELLKNVDTLKEEGNLNKLKDLYYDVSSLYLLASNESFDPKTRSTLKSLSEIYSQKAEEIENELDYSDSWSPKSSPTIGLEFEELKLSGGKNNWDKSELEGGDAICKPGESYSASPFRALVFGFQTMKEYVTGKTSKSDNFSTTDPSTTIELLEKKLKQVTEELEESKQENKRLINLMKMKMPLGLSTFLSENKSLKDEDKDDKNRDNIPTYEELLEENKRLKDQIANLMISLNSIEK